MAPSAKNVTVLTKDDFVAILRYLIELSEGRGFVDDIASDIDGYKAKIVSGETKVPTAP